MRLHLAAAALGLLALSNDRVLAQTTESLVPVTAPAAPAEAPDASIKAKIQATEKARDDLMQRFEAESAKKGSRDAKRDAQLHALSNTVCSGCGGATPSAAPRRSPPRRSAPKRERAAPDETAKVDDLH
jgi:hypothetical protein